MLDIRRILQVYTEYIRTTGNIPAPTEDITSVMIESACALGRRAIVWSGWADLALIDNGTDCLSIGDAISSDSSGVSRQRFTTVERVRRPRRR
jgi:hypothetical protein